MEILQHFFESTDIPLLSAFFLGLMTAISPCPLASNITAIGFISRNIENQRRVFISGLVYTLGRAITYTGIGLAFYFGASQFTVSDILQEWGEKLLGPLLIVVGLFMLGVLQLYIPGWSALNEKMEKQAQNGFWGALLLGLVFALAFCPYSGVLYFGILIPMTIGSASGLFLPVSFALATGIPVIVFAWFIAFSVGSMGKVYNKLKAFEIWFRRVIALLFIGVGIYQSLLIFAGFTY